ncbi:7757_t:CDS:2, partial [Scutellospora calospora]
ANNDKQGLTSTRNRRSEQEDMRKQESITILLAMTTQLKDCIDQFLQTATTTFTETIKQTIDQQFEQQRQWNDYQFELKPNREFNIDATTSRTSSNHTRMTEIGTINENNINQGNNLLATILNNLISRAIQSTEAPQLTERQESEKINKPHKNSINLRQKLLQR